MIKYLFVLSLSLFLFNAVKADTIDYWHVYYNKVKLKEFNQFNSKEPILLNVRDIKSDTLTVKYFRDTPCFDCTTFLSVEDTKHQNILTSEGKGTFNPVSFSVKVLIQFKENSGQELFEVYYFEDDRTSKILLFRIKLE